MKEIKLEKDTIHVEKKNVYGNELIYPVCQQATRFAILTGQKTLSDGAKFQIKRLGYYFKEYINCGYREVWFDHFKETTTIDI